MKRAMAILAGLLFSFCAFGQGRVAFANTSTTLINTNFLGQQGPIAGLGNFRFGLYLGNANAAESELQLALVGTNTPLAGRFSGGSPVALPAPWDLGLDPHPYPLTFQIRAWSSNGGFSYEEAELAELSGVPVLLGRSFLGTVTPTFFPTAAGVLFGTGAGQVSGFDLVAAVPEPGACALAALGFASFLFLCRRKLRR